MSKEIFKNKKISKALITLLIISMLFQCFCFNTAFAVNQGVVNGSKILIIVAHEDDETINYAGIIRNALNNGSQVRIAMVTDGSQSGSTDQGNIDYRATNLINALSTIGLNVDTLSNEYGNGGNTINNVYYLGYGDYGILSRAYKSVDQPDKVFNYSLKSNPNPDNNHTLGFTDGNSSTYINDYHTAKYAAPASYTRNNILNDITSIISDYSPDEIYMPAAYEGHPDHSSVGLFTTEAILNIKKENEDFKPKVYESILYGTNYQLPQGGTDYTAPVSTDISTFENNTPLLWDQRYSFAVPTQMSSAVPTSNAKKQAINIYGVDANNISPFDSFIRTDEVFWLEDMSNLAFNSTVTCSSEDTTNKRLCTNVIDGIVLGSPYYTNQNYIDANGTPAAVYYETGTPVPTGSTPAPSPVYIEKDISFNTDIKINHNNEWSANNETNGAWIKLDWGSNPITAKRVVLHDRPDLKDNILSGTLTFSDNSTIAVGALPKNGAGLDINFPAKTFTWVKFTINTAERDNSESALDSSTGLAEFEVFNTNSQVNDLNLSQINTSINGNSIVKKGTEYYVSSDSGIYRYSDSTFSNPQTADSRYTTRLTFDGTKLWGSQNSGCIVSSTDGIYWATNDLGYYDQKRDIAVNGNNVVVAGVNSGIIMTSHDGGITFAPENNLNLTGTMTSVNYLNGYYYAGYEHGNIYRSADGDTWAQVKGATGGWHEVRRIIYANNKYIAICSTGEIYESDTGDSDTWNLVTSGVSSLNDITWNGDYFTAVGNNGAIIASYSGDDWNKLSSPTTNNLTGIFYDSNGFVIVGSNVILSTAKLPDINFKQYSTTINASSIVKKGTNYYVSSDAGIYKSSDEAFSSPLNQDTRYTTRLTFDGTKLWASQNNGYITSSTDGISWSPQDLGYSDQKRDIAVNGNNIVAVGVSGGILMTSHNGGTSFAQTNNLNLAGTMTSVNYLNGYFYAGYEHGKIYRSADGDTWTQVKDNTGSWHEVRRIIYAINKYIAICSTGEIYVSASGDVNTWSLVSSGVSSLNDIAWNGSIFLAVGNSGTMIQSVDGVYWQTLTAQTQNNLGGVIWVNDHFMIAGSNIILSSSEYKEYSTSIKGSSIVKKGTNYYVSSDGGIYKSSDETFSNPQNLDTRYTTRLTFDGTKLWGSQNNGFITSSTDGTNWTPKDLGYNDQKRDIAVNGNNVVVAGVNADIIMTSHDGGANFTPKNNLNLTGTMTSMNYLNGYYFAGYEHGYIYRSSDGDTWTQVKGFTGYWHEVRRILCVNNRYIAICSTGEIYRTNINGTWIAVTSGVSSLNDIAWNGSYFVAVGNNGTIIKSTSGSNWTSVTSPTSNNLSGIMWDSNGFVITGDYVALSSKV